MKSKLLGVLALGSLMSIGMPMTNSQAAPTEKRLGSTAKSGQGADSRSSGVDETAEQDSEVVSDEGTAEEELIEPESQEVSDEEVAVDETAVEEEVLDEEV
ncbi:hypothetical protein ACLESO_05755, partial [Pyxidicoccus sp. 3LG]